MANKAALARLRKELKAFDPPPYIRAKPLENNLLEWRFVLQGPHDSPYEGGMYQGRLRFPDDYPFKPPSIFMVTPNGRFETDRRLCLSISDFHPESWIPTWSVASIINGVLSFMLEDTQTTGSIQTTLAEKHRLRDASVAWNAKDPIFRELWPELVNGVAFTPKPTAPPPAADEVTSSRAAGSDTAASVAASAPAAAPAAATAAATALPGPPPAAAAEEIAEPGQGKNAKKNAKKREKAKAAKAAKTGKDEGDAEEDAASDPSIAQSGDGCEGGQSGHPASSEAPVA